MRRTPASGYFAALRVEQAYARMRNLITILGLMVLVGTEVFAAAIAAGWALAGLLDLGDQVGHILMGLFSLVAAWIMVQLWRRATEAEPIGSAKRR
ncbi:hypothetical protein GCM10008965_47350 [Methylorubrum aminovorans]|nr:hypothetical protein GCM10025880_34070 [Methylorubrum aminovorans]